VKPVVAHSRHDEGETVKIIRSVVVLVVVLEGGREGGKAYEECERRKVRRYEGERARNVQKL